MQYLQRRRYLRGYAGALEPSRAEALREPTSQAARPAE